MLIKMHLFVQEASKQMTLFTADEEIFAFQRTVSRLAEMQTEQYWISGDRSQSWTENSTSPSPWTDCKPAILNSNENLSYPHCTINVQKYIWQSASRDCVCCQMRKCLAPSSGLYNLQWKHSLCEEDSLFLMSYS